MYDWRASSCPLCNLSSDVDVLLVSKVTLDIICRTAFGYDTDSLHNPDNELADAYHKMLSLQAVR